MEKEGKKVKIVYVDLDEVLCDFVGRFNQEVAKNPAIQFPQATYGFWENLEPLPWGVDGVQLLSKKYDTYILTRPSVLNAWCYTGKRVWIEKHLGIDWCHRLILNPKKGLMKGDYLIDDMKHPEFEGEHIHFGQEKFPNWPAVLKYLL